MELVHTGVEGLVGGWARACKRPCGTRASARRRAALHSPCQAPPDEYLRLSKPVMPVMPAPSPEPLLKEQRSQLFKVLITEKRLVLGPKRARGESGMRCTCVCVCVHIHAYMCVCVCVCVCV